MVTTATGILGRSYPGGPRVVETFGGKRIPVDSEADIADATSGDYVRASCEERTGYPPIVAVRVERMVRT